MLTVAHQGSEFVAVLLGNKEELKPHKEPLSP